MKIFAMALAIFLGAAHLVGEEPKLDLDKGVPVIRLTDGRVLKKVTFAKFGAETVLLRSSIGPVAVRYEALPDDIRAAAEQRRAGGAKWFAGDTSGNTETINGQVFIQTQGNSSYKFGNIPVYAFDLSLLDNFPARGVVRLPRPIHVTTTDADGKFALKVPIDRPFFIFVQAWRYVEAGVDSYTARYEWRVPMSAIRKGTVLMLSTEYRFEPSMVEIEKMN